MHRFVIATWIAGAIAASRFTVPNDVLSFVFSAGGLCMAGAAGAWSLSLCQRWFVEDDS